MQLANRDLRMKADALRDKGKLAEASVLYKEAANIYMGALAAPYLRVSSCLVQ